MSSIQPRRKNISITVLLVTAIGGLVALSVSIVLALSVAANFKNTSELLELSSQQLIASIEQQIESHLDPAQFVVNHIVRQAQRGTIDLSDKSEMITTLRASLAAAPNLTGVVIWKPDNHGLHVRRGPNNRFTIITENNKGNTPLKNYLSNLKLGKTAQWQEPLRVDGISFISISAPIYRDGQYLGAVSAGISIANLSNTLQQIDKKSSFTSYILYGDDFVLAHRNLPRLSTVRLSEKSPLHKTNEINDPVLAQFASALSGRGVFSAGDIEARLIEVGDTQHVALSSTMQRYGMKKWNIGVHAPRFQINTQLRRMFFSLLAGLGLLLASVIAAIFLARRVARPIKAISTAATHIGALELGKISRLPRSRITELNNQSQAFNQMLEGLKWFEAYVPRKLVGRLIKEHSGEAVASRQEELTVMFTDLIGFTKMSENLAPVDIANLLNEHFEVVNTCIEKTDGTLDKYIGDAVMAFWGAPEAQEDHALRACETAMCITEHFEQLETGLRMKIALHSGPLIVGNIGAQGRMNYTVIGDTVNTCSRIEKLAGDLDDGSKVITLLSEQVAKAVEGKFRVEPAGEFSVKGRYNKVNVFRLKGRV